MHKGVVSCHISCPSSVKLDQSTLAQVVNKLIPSIPPPIQYTSYTNRIMSIKYVGLLHVFMYPVSEPCYHEIVNLARLSLPFHIPLTRAVPSRRVNISCSTLPSRSIDDTCPQRPVSASKPAPVVPSRHCRRSAPSRYREYQHLFCP